MSDLAEPQNRATQRHPKLLKRSLQVVAAIIALIFLCWLILYITKGRFLKSTFERYASSATERQVRVAGDFQLYFNPINIKFLAEGLTISNPEWASMDHFVSAGLIDTSIPTFPLLFGKRRANWLNLINGRFDLEWDEAGRRNTWTFGQSTGEPFEMPLIRRAYVAGTQVRFRDPRMQLSTDIKIDTVRSTNTRIDNDIRFTGNGTMRQKPFTLAGNLKSPNETVSGGRNELVLNARSGATIMDVSGTLPGATELEGSELRVAVRGPNMADLFDFLGVAVPDSRTYRMTSALTKAGEEWRFTGLKGTVGESDLSGSLTVAPIKPRLLLTADLRSDTLDIVDAGPWIGYDPNRLEKQGNSGIVRRVGGIPRLLPDAKLRADSLRTFDARLKYRIRRVRAESLPVSNIDLTLNLDNSLLSLAPLTFDMARGHVTSEIALNARAQPVQTTYDIRLSPTPMGVLLAGFGVEESGTTGTLKARIQIKGEGDTLHESLATSDGRIAVILPRGSLWTRNIQLSELDIGTFVQKMFEGELKEPVQINCGLIAFTVRNGVAAADPILIDTRKNVILGRGGFSFRNESLDLAMRADSKKFSLLAGQSPVGVTGFFAEPKIDPISGELLTRAGGSLALGIVAAPVAAVLAFVDAGDAKSAACGPVLSGASAVAQRTSKGELRDDVGRGTTAKAEDGKATKGQRREQRKKFLGIF